jgi:ABC-type Fe3+/spermidine/putrescine transport system ATPase subunit
MVRLLGHDIEVASPEIDISQSENWSLSIRPEKVLISGSAAGFPNAMAATIKTIIFKGAMQELILNLANDVNIRATVSSAGTNAREGDHVFVGFRPDDALLMAAD